MPWSKMLPTLVLPKVAAASCAAIALVALEVAGLLCPPPLLADS
jgi:tellurite resistance protein TehA-like permease